MNPLFLFLATLIIGGGAANEGVIDTVQEDGVKAAYEKVVDSKTGVPINAEQYRKSFND